MNAIKQTAMFLRIMSEWIGDGLHPVSREKAESRSKVCEVCPLNSVVHGKWWESAKDEIAGWIKQAISVKDHIALRVSNEDKLFMCSACGCATRLKVHVPIEHIKVKTSRDVIDKFDANCWIRKELQ